MSIIDAIIDIWNTFLLYPFYNILILIYQTVGFKSLGVSIIILTVLLRLILVPLSIKSGKTEEKLKRVEPEIQKIERDVRDHEKKKRLIRETLREHNIDPLTDIFSLLFQSIFFLLLYQAFKLGFDSSNFDFIYTLIPAPAEDINPTSFGINLEHPDIQLGVITAILLFVFIISAQKAIVNYRAQNFSGKWYAFIMPVAIFGITQLLPSAKSLFLATSFAFSIVFKIAFQLIFKKEFKGGGEV